MSTAQSPIEVVAAVFHRNGKYLVCRRKPGLSNAGQWEFPGGKRNPDECHAAALIREIDEELRVKIVVGESLGSTTHRYSDKTIELHCFLVDIWSGDFVLTDHDDLQWHSIEQLRELRLSAADVPFVERIQHSRTAKQSVQ